MAAFLGRRYKGILGTGSALGQEGIILPSAVAPSYDPDAQVYFTAVEDAGGELTLLEKDLVNTWFVTERAAGRLSKYKAVYPFKGKTSGAAAINMVNPSTYDLSFTNFVTADFAVSGVITPDGSTKYASLPSIGASDIFASPYDTFIYAYAQTASTSGSNRVIIGGRDNASTNFLNIYPSTIANGIFAQGPTNLFLQTGSGNDLLDRESCSYLRTSDSQAYLYRNSIEEDNKTTTVSGNLPSNDMTVFAWNNNGVISAYSDGEWSVTVFAEGIDSSEVQALDESFKEIVVDKDAQAYIQEVFDQGGSLTLAQQHAVNNLVKSMKADGLWDGVIRLYPFMGGTIDSARVDMKTLTQATNNNFVDADTDALIGLQGDGSTKYLLETVGTSSIISSNADYQIGAFFDGLTLTGSNQSLFGVQDTSTGFLIWDRIFSAGTPLRYAGTNAGAFTTPAFGTSSDIIARFSTTSAYGLADGIEGTEFTTNVSAIAVTADRLGWFADYVNDLTPNYISSSKHTGGFIAEGWTLAETKKFERIYKAFIQQVQDEETYDTDAAAYFIAVEDAGGTLTDNVKDEFDAFVVREKAGGRWGKLKRLYPYLGGVINSAVIDAITLNSATNTNFVDGDVDSLIGLQGDGSTKSLRLTETTNLILPDSTDFQIGVFRIGAVEQPSSLSRLMGHFSSANSLGRLYLQKNQPQPQVFATDNVVAAGGVLSTDSSHIGASFSSSDLNVLLDGVVVNTNSTARSTSFSTDLMDLFALNINGTPSSFSSIKSGGMFIASGLSLTETQAFESSYKTFINNITA